MGTFDSELFTKLLHSFESSYEKHPIFILSDYPDVEAAYNEYKREQESYIGAFEALMLVAETHKKEYWQNLDKVIVELDLATQAAIDSRHTMVVEDGVLFFKTEKESNDDLCED